MKVTKLVSGAVGPQGPSALSLPRVAGIAAGGSGSSPESRSGLRGGGRESVAFRNQLRG